ncbi:phage tail fiber protein [Budvicia aquatica]
MTPSFAKEGDKHYALTLGDSVANIYQTQLALPRAEMNQNASIGFRCNGRNGWQPWVEILTSINTTVDANGFIKKASPIVQLKGDGSCHLNDGSQGVTTERLSEGVYRLSGLVMGFYSDGAWDISVPKDDNDLSPIWVDSVVEATGDIIVKTYHRTYPDAPVFARNNLDGYKDGDPIDIPVGRWVDLRVQVYRDDIEELPVDEIIDVTE